MEDILEQASDVQCNRCQMQYVEYDIAFEFWDSSGGYLRRLTNKLPKIGMSGSSVIHNNMQNNWEITKEPKDSFQLVIDRTLYVLLCGCGKDFAIPGLSLLC